MILLIDNYDSFVFNLARYFERLGQETVVVRNDAITVEQVAELAPTALVLSPGPCSPVEAGCSLELVRRLGERMPILGVCLGHQTLAMALGGRVVRATEPVHGRCWPIYHEGGGIFAGLPNPMLGCRYHSLVAERQTLPDCFEVTAWTDDGTIMAIEHRQRPLVGIQFHPESILTECGYPLLTAFLRRAGARLPAELPSIDSERTTPAELDFLPPVGPVTF
ncbi:MAG TPA: aminodeoxychorismate/anthranilate synthase component II [Pirellulales bacterium]|jgi:anthranilate synthase/aminodeoxychorismate synthase-like glutamine amidotransferase|nr:aminodeoxychorismate/anthranilate synthase component II [Pirellulales bacterium]